MTNKKACPIGIKIKEVREKTGLTQKIMAKELGYNTKYGYQFMSDLENGNKALKSLAVIEKIESRLDMILERP